MPGRAPAIVWFTSDLRLSDHPALASAARSQRPLLACYIDDPALTATTPGAASRWWLHHSLARLSAMLRKRGGRLVLRSGSTRDVLLDLVARSQAGRVHATRSHVPELATVQADLARELERAGATLALHDGMLLFDPRCIRTRTGRPYRVFTPFWRTCLGSPPPEAPEACPKRIRFHEAELESENLSDWRLRPTAPNWASNFGDIWQPGEEGAHARLERFLEMQVANYSVDRDRPDRPGTSRLSPHLHFGEISPRQVWHAVYGAAVMQGAGSGAEAFLRELGWREFSYHLMWHWPELCREPFRAEFRTFPWRSDAEALFAWQRGRTGYPIVDAGMRELWETGWMHNRARMLTASFLVKDLRIHWTRGAEWFADTLVDADLANNCVSWQWVAGSGADAAPYFRIFNPELQGRKFDPAGDYVRRWVPEVAGLPGQHIHAPYRAPADVLSSAGVQLGESYPRPIVDHRQARIEALRAYEHITSSGATRK